MIVALLAATASDAVQGGTVAAVVGFAAGLVKVAVGQTDKERVRGDRLEIAMLDKVLPAIGQATVAMSGATEVMRTIQTERQAEREAALRRGDERR